MNPVTVDKIIAFFEKEFADLRRQAGWDYSGRQVYLGDKPVTKICVALDPTKKVIKAAKDRGCELIITHHPLFFGSVKNLDIRHDIAETAIFAIQNNINILSYHTNLDGADKGLNVYLLSLLGARDEGLLTAEGSIKYVKLAGFVPEGYEDKALDAVQGAGAGQIGNYRRCAFMTKGTGTFTPVEGANPFIGELGKAEYVSEIRLEMLVEADKAEKALSALQQAHPYEEPAIEIIPVENGKDYGYARIGNFLESLSFSDFTKLLKDILGVSVLRTNMPYDKKVSRFAVCTGSGASYWKECIKMGVDLLVTGDLKHHDAVSAASAGVCIIDAGHYETERIYISYLATVLRESFGLGVFEAPEEPSIQII